MTGIEAAIELLKGKKIRRQIWEDVNYWCLKNNKMCTQNGHVFNMTFNELIMGDDWELFDSKLDFYQALEKMKDGFKVLNVENGFTYFVENGQLKCENDASFAFVKDLNSKIWELIED